MLSQKREKEMAAAEEEWKEPGRAATGKHAIPAGIKILTLFYFSDN